MFASPTSARSDRLSVGPPPTEADAEAYVASVGSSSRCLYQALSGGVGLRVTPAEASLQILFVGSRILPYRHAGDKSYWLEVLRELMDRGHDVDVLSVTGERVPEPFPFPSEFISPIPFNLGGGNRFNREHQWLRASGNYSSKTLSFGRIVRAIRRHVRSRRPDVIHLLSNYGPIMGLLRPFTLRVPISVSAPTYNGWRALYDIALRTSFLGFDRIVPFSDAYGRRLEALGVPRRRIRRIRWAVNTERLRPPTDAVREEARQKLGVRPGERVVVWSGFLQQMKPRDLERSARVAELVTQSTPGRMRFFFCLKPEHHDPRYRRFERPGVTVGSSTELFHLARTAADVLLSPIFDLRSTAAPPLTWIECMALGIPVATTPLPGVEEIVSDGVNGVVARTPEELARRLVAFLDAADELAEAGRSARRRAEERFSLSTSVSEYVALWSEMAAGRSSA